MAHYYLINSGVTPHDNWSSFDCIYMKDSSGVYKVITIKDYVDRIVHSELRLIQLDSGSQITRSTKKKLMIEPGEYYPRVFRPLLDSRQVRWNATGQLVMIENGLNLPIYLPANERDQLLAINQIIKLKEKLELILEVLYPTKKNLSSYGGAIGDLLVNACIEVENQLKGIYKANQLVHGRDNSYNMTKYYELNKHLHLNKYTVTLSLFPDLTKITPFQRCKSSGRSGNTTYTTNRYSDYNQLKHNNTQDFYRGNLKNAINALCAVVALYKAQYGENFPFGGDVIRSFFKINNIEWKFNEKILPPIEGSQRTEKKLGLAP